MNNPLAQILREEIQARGVMPFARFMDLSLYHPEHGYYEREQGVVGRGGDFYTSVSVGSLFGELLAFQFATWFAAECNTTNVQSPLRLIEAGAHDGKLAADILGWLRKHRAEQFAKLEYCLVEPSVRRRSWQEKTLVSFAPRVRWFTELSEVPTNESCFTICFANELLDAFPVQRVGWNAQTQKWFEWGVTVRDKRFEWARMENFISPFQPALPPALLAILPDGFTTEISPRAEPWWRAAAATVARGKLLTLDYGLTHEEFFAPSRAHGTLRAYHEHRVSADLLAQPGEQDLTAQVNFTALQRAGEAAGLQTESCISQSQFLTRIAKETWKSPDHFPEWNTARLRQFQTLTHPDHLGRAFRVLVQGR